jgi:hypothetical protein
VRLADLGGSWSGRIEGDQCRQRRAADHRVVGRGTVLVDASTEVLHREVRGIDLRVGDAVRIVPGFGAGPRGALAPGGDAATGGDAGELPASQVVVLESGGA